jgi:hypothetical protein
MPDDARTLWVSACQLCISETDGYLGIADLDLLLPADAARRQAALQWLLASRLKFRLVPHIRDFAVKGEKHAGTAEPDHARTATYEQQCAIVYPVTP